MLDLQGCHIYSAQVLFNLQLCKCSAHICAPNLASELLSIHPCLRQQKHHCCRLINAQCRVNCLSACICTSDTGSVCGYRCIYITHQCHHHQESAHKVELVPREMLLAMTLPMRKRNPVSSSLATKDPNNPCCFLGYGNLALLTDKDFS